MGPREPADPLVGEAQALELGAIHWDAGNEAPEVSRAIPLGERPYAEKTEHVVDAVAGIVFPRLGETVPPEAEALPLEDLPIVNREVPVLAEAREGIGRGPGAQLELEDRPVRPDIGGVGVYQYGQIAHKGDSPPSESLGGRAELSLCPHLDPRPAAELAYKGFVLPQGLDVPRPRLGMDGPLPPGPLLVPALERDEGGVGPRPGIGGYPRLELGVRLCLRCRSLDRGPDRLQQIHLGAVEFLVAQAGCAGIALDEGTRAIAQALPSSGLRGQLGKIADPYMDGIEGEGRPGEIRGILGARIIDRQKLDQVEAPGRGQVAQLFEVGKFAAPRLRLGPDGRERGDDTTEPTVAVRKLHNYGPRFQL